MRPSAIASTAAFGIIATLLIFIIGAPAILTADNPPASFTSDVFKQRRQALMDSLGEGTAVLYSRGYDTQTGYRAGSLFWYLTGISDEGAILMLSPGEKYKDVLFLPPRNPEAERWHGWSPELTDSLRHAWGFDLLKRTGRLNGMIMQNMKHHPVLHLISNPVGPDSPIPPDLEFYRKITSRVPGVSIKNSSQFTEHMRMIKSPVEIAAIEKAIAITHHGLTRVLAEIRPGITEYQLEAVLETGFKELGSQHMAFGAIIGCGENSIFLHYQHRSDSLESGQLVLMDVGAEWEYYSADITRAVPVDGKFSEEQAEIYDIVLAAQQAGIDAVKPGATYYDIDEAARDVLRQAGYIDDYWHGTGHHLGLSTHDPADYGAPLEPGMVITIEPGIYLPEKGFGIRIEDDVLVTENGSRVLSSAIPKTRTEVEAWMAEAKK
jgi:Xaa-Pro aminopeptidase